MAPLPYQRLGVNIDHVATVRNARGTPTPDPLRAAQLAAKAGADGITAHLREDRRHIVDDDIARLKDGIELPLNFEMAATEEMVAIALRHRPHAACIVPEKRAATGPTFAATVALYVASSTRSSASQPGMLAWRTAGSLSAVHTVAGGAGIVRSLLISIVRILSNAGIGRASALLVIAQDAQRRFTRETSGSAWAYRC